MSPSLQLFATRLVPPLRELLRRLWALKPFENQPAFAPLYAPGFWLVTIGVVVVARASLPRVIAKSARSAWRACAVTLVFVVMAELAPALQVAAGREATLGVPAFAAIGGFLTGGGSAANAMLMPMVIALARALALDSLWIAEVQNSVSTNFSMLSPIRISMGAAILGLKVSDAELDRRGWPLALPPMTTGFAAIALLFGRLRRLAMPALASSGFGSMIPAATQDSIGSKRWPKWRFWVSA